MKYNLTINSSVTRNVSYFAYDGHHKFYLIENSFEAYEAEEDGLEIHGLNELPELWANSAITRYMASFRRDEDGNREMIIPQCQSVESFIIDGKKYEVNVFIDIEKTKGRVI